MHKPNLDTVRKILLQHWDPIGIGDVPEAADEYDQYAAEILQMLETGVGRDRIEAYLDSVTADRIGLRVTETLRDRINRAANLLWHDPLSPERTHKAGPRYPPSR